MIRVNVVCEGSTEENFVSKVLYPYFILKNIFVTPRNIGTGSSYDKLKFNVQQWLKEEPRSWVTTLIDLYGMGKRFPAYNESKNLSAYHKVAHIEQALKEDIDKLQLDKRRFIPYVQLYEFEAILFSECDIFEEFLSLDYEFPINSLHSIRSQFETPEHINDNPLTAPSKRIKAIIPSFDKPFDGIIIAEAIGLDIIRKECKHFNEWLVKLENLQWET